MRTTLDLPDEMFRQLKAEAALRGAKLKDLIAQFIEKGWLSGSPLLNVGLAVHCHCCDPGRASCTRR
jgi:hypothetical protein